jgi:peptide/nickel transport system permease protein
VGAYLVRRFGLMMLTLFGISIIIFMLLRLTPGNIADILFDAGGFVDPADKARIEADLGLDKPIPVQYAVWIGGLLRGDLGISYQTERPAIQEIAPRIPITAKLAGLALTFSVLLGVPLGVVSAVKQNTRLDYILRVISLSGLSMPAFWLGLLILMAFVAYFGTIPIYSSEPSGFWNTILMYSVPAAAVGFRSSALLMRLTRSSMLEVLRQDYIRTARSKGLNERMVVIRHALRNAMIPVTTLFALQVGVLFGGTVVLESIFTLPGLGFFTLQAVRNKDYTEVQGVVLFFAAVLVFINLLVDVSYAWIDPRIRYSS